MELMNQVEAVMRLTNCPEICRGPCNPESHAFDVTQPPFAPMDLLSEFGDSDEEAENDIGAENVFSQFPTSLANPLPVSDAAGMLAASVSQVPPVSIASAPGASFVAPTSSTMPANSATLFTGTSTPAAPSL